jgi:predicted nucleic acid-binding protein
MGPAWEGLKPPEVVCDAGPLIHLDEIDSLDLLSDFEKVLVPEQVWEEFLRHRAESSTTSALFERIFVEVPSDPAFQAIVRAFSLDQGEQAALGLMRLHPNAVLLTDDAAARIAAKTLELRSHGTVGILLRAIRRGQRTRSEVISLLQSLPSRSTLHFRRSLLAEIIRQVEELEI